MPSGTEFEQEARALESRKWNNGLLALAAAAVVTGAVGAYAWMAAPVLAGVLAVAGAGLFAAAYIRSSRLENENVDFQARRSAAGLTQSLAEKGIELTPEQQAAIHQEEYDKTSAEWRERVEEVKRARSIGD